MPTLTTETLDIAYEDSGPEDGPVVLLLHGWPDDATTWAGVAPALNAAGLRTLVPREVAERLVAHFSGARPGRSESPRC